MSTAARAEDASRRLACQRAARPVADAVFYRGRLPYFGFVTLTGTGSRASFVSARSSRVPARTA